MPVSAALSVMTLSVFASIPSAREAHRDERAAGCHCVGLYPSCVSDSNYIT